MALLLNNNMGSANYVSVYKRTFRDDEKYYEQVGDKIKQDATKHYGMSVSLSGAGHRLAVGAMYNTPAGGFGITVVSGKAFVYSIQDNGVNLLGEFSPQDPGSYNSVQVSLSEDGRRAAIGTVGHGSTGRVGLMTVHEATPNDLN